MQYSDVRGKVSTDATTSRVLSADKPMEIHGTLVACWVQYVFITECFITRSIYNGFFSEFLSYNKFL